MGEVDDRSQMKRKEDHAYSTLFGYWCMVNDWLSSIAPDIPRSFESSISNLIRTVADQLKLEHSSFKNIYDHVGHVIQSLGNPLQCLVSNLLKDDPHKTMSQVYMTVTDLSSGRVYWAARADIRNRTIPE